MNFSLSKIIKEKLEEQHLSVRALEQKAGLKRSAVQNILNGLSISPRIETINAIADALDCKVEELVGPQDLIGKIKRKESNTLDLPFNQSKLLKMVVDEVLSAIGKREISNKQTFFILQETFLYCLENKKETVDQSFVNWLIKKFD